MESEQERKRKLIINSYLKNPGISQRQLAKSLKIAKTTIQNVLAKFKEVPSVQRKRGTGKKRGSVNENLQKEVIRRYKRKPNLSVRDMAEQVGTSK